LEDLIDQNGFDCKPFIRGRQKMLSPPVELGENRGVNRLVSLLLSAMARPLHLVLAALFLAIVSVLFYWRPSWHCQRQQSALIEAIEDNNEKQLQQIISRDYRDRWDFNREGIILTIRDVRSQFVSMSVTPREQRFSRSGKKAVFESRFFLDGIVKGPGGAGARQQINQLEDPMVFTWRRTGFLPSSWQLVQIENAAIPDDIWGYEPGSLQKMKLDNLGF